LYGFDFGGDDIYQPKPVVGINFINQYKKILEEFIFIDKSININFYN